MRSRIGRLATFAFAATAACGPEAQLFDKVTGRDEKPPKPRSITVESSFYPEKGSGTDSEPTCAEEYYKDKLCFEEERVCMWPIALDRGATRPF